MYGLKLIGVVVSGAACTSFTNNDNQTLKGALIVIDYLIRQISINRATDMWNELNHATLRLYSKVPSIRSLIESKTGIIVANPKATIIERIVAFWAKLFGK